jgi:hypothetical protein
MDHLRTEFTSTLVINDARRNLRDVLVDSLVLAVDALSLGCSGCALTAKAHACGAAVVLEIRCWRDAGKTVRVKVARGFALGVAIFRSRMSAGTLSWLMLGRRGAVQAPLAVSLAIVGTVLVVVSANTVGTTGQVEALDGCRALFRDVADDVRDRVGLVTKVAVANVVYAQCREALALTRDGLTGLQIAGHVFVAAS